MSLEKAIASGKEHRKAYGRCKAVDSECRNHGGCDHCLKNRTYRTQKELEKARFSRIDADSAEP